MVSQLESDELSLEQSLDQFKRGVELTRQCQLILDEAQKTVDLLSQYGDDSEAEDRRDDDTR